MKYSVIVIFLLFIIPGQAQLNYEYDNLNRLTKVQYPNGVVVTYTYDALGNRLTKNKTPGIPAIINLENTTIPSGSIACYNATQTITLAGNGTTFIVPVNAHVELIAGQNIRFLPGVSVAQGSWLTGKIRPGGPWCNSAKSVVSDITGNEKNEDSLPFREEEWQVRAWPNPVSGDLTVEWTMPDNRELTRVEIGNLMGIRIFSTQLTGVNTISVPMGFCPSGIYILKIIRKDKSVVRKIIRQ